ncbi:MAG: GNAT family N-acetyltransferase [Methanotrichaceae archaeon]|nr:GNAT family N-acetyltransferase [Methanotrichaceae archaeon]
MDVIGGDVPAGLEVVRTTSSGLGLVLRPARSDDLPRLKEFFGSLSDQSMYQRFSSARREVPEQRLQQFLSVDCSRNMLILAEIKGKEEVVGLGQYSLNPETHLAEVALVVRDDYQSRGVGREIHRRLTEIARGKGVLGFTAEVLQSNYKALSLLQEMGFESVSRDDESCEMRQIFEEEVARRTELPQNTP